VVMTDSESWAGGVHPVQALADYRRASRIDARLVVVGLVANEVSIADPAARYRCASVVNVTASTVGRRHLISWSA
jgi:hypothetical protein